MSSRANIKVKKQYLYSKIVNKIILKILKMKKNNNACKEPSLKRKEIYLILLCIGRGYKFLLANFLNIFMQKEKAWKITRRLMFELEWRFRGELVLTSGAFKLGNLVTNLFYPSFRWIQFRVILVKNVPNS